MIAILHKCSFCGETDPNKFYGHKKYRCGNCHNKDTIRRFKENKDFTIQFLGGKCSICGYNKCSIALEVHHLDPAKKDPNFKSSLGWSKDRITKELEGCVLLCANCHRETHFEELNKLCS